jgi:anti-sigma regulatory factor (Ser/Thr protein kinase)
MTMSDSSGPHRFAACFAALPSLLARARAACALAGLDPALTRQVELVLEEAFANTLHHGYRGEDAGKDVWLACEGGVDGLRLIYQDAAAPFDSLASALQPEEGSVGGLGCLLIRSLPGAAAYSRIGERNTLTLDFPRRP